MCGAILECMCIECGYCQRNILSYHLVMKQLLMARQQQMDDDIDSQAIVNDFLSHQLSLKGYQWTPSVNQITNQQSSLTLSRQTEITDALRTLGEEYMNQYGNEFDQMCEPLQLTPSTAYSIFLSISNELFCEGIKWSHIVTYLVFGVEFALYTVQKGYPQLVSEISHWLSDYLNLHLINWIKDHGGWVSSIVYYYLLNSFIY